MRENNLPGSTPATMNSTKTMSIGTHKVSNVKSEDNCTEYNRQNEMRAV